MKSCLYCGVVDICENFNNDPKNCKNYMRRATVTDLIKLGIFTRTTAPQNGKAFRCTFKEFQIDQIKSIIEENKLRDKFIFRFKGGEIYFRPIKLTKKWEGLFYEKNQL